MADADAAAGPKIAILMGVFNGGAFLQDQLDSFADQTVSGWTLLASDDGSTDDSLAILDQFSETAPVQIQAGPRAGFAANFLSLLRFLPEHFDYAALSDQDDVWFKDRLERGVAALHAVDGPALYCARTMVTDAALNPLHPTPLFARPASFQNALVQSLGGGNTMMLNRAGLDLVAQAAAEAGDIVAHDWWLYQLISGCGGSVINDPDPVLFYRQHSGNEIGANRSAAARWSRLKRVLGRDYAKWHDINIPALNRSAHRMTGDAQQALKAFERARQGGVIARLRALRASGVYRQSRLGTVALYLACALGRL
jgi:glycosyltransferase involved in cell wall biosynthesis